MFRLITTPPRVIAAVDAEPLSLWRALDGDVATTFHRTEAGYLVHFPDLVDFEIDVSARTVTCTCAPDADSETVECLYTNQIEPLLRTWDGELVLHASGVVIDNVAVAFFGRSRRGKSTLAGAFARAGYPCVTDDGLILHRDETGFQVEPKVTLLRLLPDSELALVGSAQGPAERTAKARIELPGEAEFHREPLPLGALYFMQEPCSETFTVQRLEPGEATALALEQTFMLDIGDKDRMRAHFDSLAFLSETVPIFSLDYPRDYAQLPGIIEHIAAHFRTNRG